MKGINLIIKVQEVTPKRCAEAAKGQQLVHTQGGPSKVNNPTCKEDSERLIIEFSSETLKVRRQ
jgi:hypothetical protein